LIDYRKAQSDIVEAEHEAAQRNNEPGIAMGPGEIEVDTSDDQDSDDEDDEVVFEPYAPPGYI
jgi:hypothetical protein